eukprot:2446_1
MARRLISMDSQGNGDSNYQDTDISIRSRDLEMGTATPVFPKIVFYSNGQFSSGMKSVTPHEVSAQRGFQLAMKGLRNNMPIKIATKRDCFITSNQSMDSIFHDVPKEFVEPVIPKQPSYSMKPPTILQDPAPVAKFKDQLQEKLVKDAVVVPRPSGMISSAPPAAKNTNSNAPGSVALA